MIAFIGLAIGYAAGVFAASNIVLPLLWSWPRARRLHQQGRLVRPIPATAFFIAPVVWSVLVLISLLLVDGLFTSALGGYLLGLAVGFGQILRLVFSPNNDMEADFTATFGPYLRTPSVNP